MRRKIAQLLLNKSKSCHSNNYECHTSGDDEFNSRIEKYIDEIVTKYKKEILKEE